MTTAMARLPCKQPTLSSQQQVAVDNYATAGYWDTRDTRDTRDTQPTQSTQSTNTYARNHRHRHGDYAGKRRSAVELLQESKAFYVKSETVLDRKQELKNSGHLQVSQLTAPNVPLRLLRKSSNAGSSYLVHHNSVQFPHPPLTSPTPPPPPSCWGNCHDQDRADGPSSPQKCLPPPSALPPKSPRLVPLVQRRAISGSPNGNGNDQLQIKLRRLLNTESKENVYLPETLPSVPNNGILREDKLGYSPGLLSPSYRDDERISPGVPLLDVRFKFGRSNSHSHSSRRSGKKSNDSSPAGTTVCHKSLPDLHTSTRRRSSLSPHASSKSSSRPSKSRHQSTTNNYPDCETSSDYSEHSFKRDASCYRSFSSKHIRRSLGSGGGDASSVLSSGGRTQKSSGSSKLSHGATARDSGGSSGHCTHRSEPSPRAEERWSHIRRDSGASTQHSTELKDRSRKNSSGSGTQSILQAYTPDSDSSDSRTEISPTQNSRFSDVGWKEERGRPILRSKSDISDRYRRHDNHRFNNSHHPRSIAQLEIFFDRLGLDSENYHRITETDSKSSSPVFFDSVSSVDSALGVYSWVGTNQANQWENNNAGNATSNGDSIQKSSDPPSIVERNARIIKWLCQCRKVQFGYS